MHLLKSQLLQAILRGGRVALELYSPASLQAQASGEELSQQKKAFETHGNSSNLSSFRMALASEAVGLVDEKPCLEPFKHV